jgi:hypothetical protein
MEDKYTTEYNQVLLKTKHDSIQQEDMCPFGGCMYETYGDELQYVREQPNKRTWTIVDTDGNHLLIIAGFHIVNRLGYLITNEEWEDEYEEFLID